MGNEYCSRVRHDAIAMLHRSSLQRVLDHLVYPFAAVKAAAGVPGRGGYLLLSFPNICNLVVLNKLLLHGFWDYQDSGILVRGHLRFFTRKSFLSAMAEACPTMAVEAVQTKPNRQTVLVSALSRLFLVGEFFCCEFIVKCRRLLTGTTS